MTYLLNIETKDGKEFPFVYPMLTNLITLACLARQIVQNPNIKFIDITDTHGESKLLIEK